MKRILVILLQLTSLVLVKALSTIASSDSLEQQTDYDLRPGCYFSAEYQGDFVMQINSGNNVIQSRTNYLDESQPVVQYSVLNISYNSIPVWGYCYKKIDDKYLLRDVRGGYSECIRCFRLTRRSRNIIEVFYEDLNRCYTNEAGATGSCNKLESSSILYRTKEIGGQEIRNEYCPIAGKYRFKYDVNYNYVVGENNHAEVKDECIGFSSDINNCPDGSLLHLQFKRCTFEDHDISLECLGSWPAISSDSEEGSQFVAFIDSRGSDDFSGPAKRRRPRYRCGLFHADSKKGKTYLTLSSDSSCSRNLFNSTIGYERLILTKTTIQKNMPNYVKSHLATFPKWAQGEWEETLIVNGTMTFNDLNGYKSYTFVTVDSNEETGHYIVFSRDQCEQEAYVCLAMKQRSENVLEFTTGSVSSPIYQSSLCDDTNLQLNRSDAVWWTLARLERTVQSPCPITGQYIGQITDLPGMCAELSSNCHTKEIMYFKVSDCKTGELFEERTYICLGQWEEGGVTYTYTMRNDTGTNECFVGKIINEEEIYIKEAGDYCIRNLDPRAIGMRLYKKGQCYGNSASPAPTTPTKESSSNDVPIMRITTPIRTVTTRIPTIYTKPRDVRITPTTHYPKVVKSSSAVLFRDLNQLVLLSCTLFIIKIHLQFFNNHL